MTFREAGHSNSIHAFYALGPPTHFMRDAGLVST